MFCSPDVSAAAGDPEICNCHHVTESAIVGLLAGTIGAVAGTTLAAVVLEKGMEIPFHFEIVPPLVAILLAGLFAAAAGLAASARPLAQRPIEALRAS